MGLKKTSLVAIAVAATLVAANTSAQVRGVTKDEILLGSHIDLSGPIAELGRAGVNAGKMAEEEINAAGGIHGRKLRIIWEDSGYDPKKAVLVTQKMIDKDGIFALIMATGNAPAEATYPMLIKSGVPNLFAWAGSPMFTEPLEKISFAFFPTTGDTMAPAVKHFADQGKKRFCFIYQDDGFGADVKEGVERALKAAKLQIIEEVGYKRGTTDFSAQVARMQRGNCDMLLLGTVPAPAAGIVQEVRRRNWNIPILASSNTNDESTLRLGKEAMEGVHAAVVIPNPDPDRSPPAVKEWLKKYQAKYNQPGSLYGAYGYAIVHLAAESLRRAGPNLTVDSLVKGVESIKGYKTIFGGPTVNFSDKDHKGMRGALLYKVEGGRWVPEGGELQPVQ